MCFLEEMKKYVSVASEMMSWGYCGQKWMLLMSFLEEMKKHASVSSEMMFWGYCGLDLILLMGFLATSSSSSSWVGSAFRIQDSMEGA